MNKPNEITQLFLDALRLACTSPESTQDKSLLDKMITISYRIQKENLDVSLKSRDE